MSIKPKVKKLLRPFRSWLVGDTNLLLTYNSLLAGRMASWQVRSQKVINSLRDVEFKINSQWGEDGIIDWLVERANIPRNSRSFIEFGVQDYREANTRFLMQNRNWRGLIMDGNADMVEAVKEDGLAWAYDLTVLPAFITRENINTLIAKSGFSGEIGLLSIDIDGNDYWAWEAIDIINPIIVICEYNAVFGDLHPISVPYDPEFNRTKKHYSNLYFGASIGALQYLASRKGYRFVGTTLAANDSFFVREDYANRFVDESLRDIRAEPSLVRESRNEHGQLNYLGGIRRLQELAAMPVVNVVTGESLALGHLSSIYSEQWLETMTGASEIAESLSSFPT